MDELGVKIVLKWNPPDIDKQKEALENYINKTPLKIKIELDDKKFKELSNNLQSLNTNLNKALNINPNTSGLNNFEQKIDTIQKKIKSTTVEFFDANKALTGRKEIEELSNSLGELQKITTNFSAGNETSSSVENTTNYEKQRIAVDKLNASKLKLLTTIEKYKGVSGYENVVDSINGLNVNTTATGVQNIKTNIDALKQQQQIESSLFQTELNRVKNAEKLASTEAKILNKEQLQQYELNLKSQEQINNALLETVRQRRIEQEKIEKIQANAINKNSDVFYKEQQKLIEEEKTRKQETSDYVRKLTHEEEQERLKTTTDVQKQIERTITGSNETILQQQRRILKNEDNGNSYEQMWFKAEQAQDKVIQAKIRENELTRESIRLYQQELNTKIKNAQTTYGKHLSSTGLESIKNQASLLDIDNFESKKKQIDADFKDITANARALRRETTLAMKEADSFVTTLTKDFGKMLAWGMVATALYAPLRAIQSGITYIYELDNALNEIRIVTGQSQEQVEKLADSYNKLAKEMSVTTSELAKTSADLYRQGLNDSQVEERMKSIIKYAKISSISLEDSNKIITATANATGESVNKIIDIFAYLGDTTASGKHMCPSA
ncbi:MAG: phage tail tape measure protein [Patescibacteria group bacterium]|jgi:hypothetical protein